MFDNCYVQSFFAVNHRHKAFGHILVYGYECDNAKKN